MYFYKVIGWPFIIIIIIFVTTSKAGAWSIYPASHLWVNIKMNNIINKIKITSWMMSKGAWNVPVIWDRSVRIERPLILRINEPYTAAIQNEGGKEKEIKTIKGMKKIKKGKNEARRSRRRDRSQWCLSVRPRPPVLLDRWIW